MIQCWSYTVDRYNLILTLTRIEKMDPLYIYPEVGFWTPIVFDSESKSCKETCIEAVDNYFHLWGRKAHVFDGKKARLSENIPFSFTLSTISKIILIVFIPILLVIKACLRYHYRFEIVKDGHMVPLLFCNMFSPDKMSRALSKAVEEIQKHNPEVGICQLSMNSENQMEQEKLLKESKQLYIVTHGPTEAVFSPEGPYHSPLVNNWIEEHKAIEGAALHYLDPVWREFEPRDIRTTISQVELNALNPTMITIQRHIIRV